MLQCLKGEFLTYLSLKRFHRSSSQVAALKSYCFRVESSKRKEGTGGVACGFLGCVCLFLFACFIFWDDNPPCLLPHHHEWTVLCHPSAVLLFLTTSSCGLKPCARTNLVSLQVDYLRYSAAVKITQHHCLCVLIREPWLGSTGFSFRLLWGSQGRWKRVSPAFILGWSCFIVHCPQPVCAHLAAAAISEACIEIRHLPSLKLLCQLSAFSHIY